MNFGSQTAKIGPSYVAILRKCWMLFLFLQAFETEATELNSTNLCNMLGSEPGLQTRVKHLRGSLLWKLGS